MTPKEKAGQLVYGMYHVDVVNLSEYGMEWNMAKQCALIAIENEYYSLKEQLFNLRSCGIIESEKVYLFRLQELINEEKEVKQEIEKL